jgi:hypothetical protein
LNLEDKRETLFGVLHHVLSVSCRKFDYEKASNADRLAWGRLIVSATQAYGKLLETVEIEELLERVERLEKAQGQRTPIFP